MNVLSLFDGISCGRVALERAGIPVTNYYASEIDKYAIQVSQKNYPDIIHLGDVNNWESWQIEWFSIDLILAGSAQDRHGILIDKYIRKLTPIECERLQTLPDNYTVGISNTQRYKCLGNGWTVDVIAHILKHLN